MKTQLIVYTQSTKNISSSEIFEDEVILDLYADEEIPLVLNADDFTNIVERASSYSKSFQIPGTKNNNLFFNHIYDLTSDTSFNPHLKTKCLVKVNRVDVFSGYLQLNDIIRKEDNTSYEITLFSEVINLKDTLSVKSFRDLDFSELNHAYNETNIKASFTGTLQVSSSLPSGSFAGTGTTTSVVKYPFVRWNTESQYDGTDYQVIDAQNVFKPFLNIKYILQNILNDAGYTYSSAFIDSAAFNKLYTDFHRGNTSAPGTSGQFRVSNTADVTYGTGTFTKLDFNTIENNTFFGSYLIGANYYDVTDDEFTSTGTQMTVRLYLDIGTCAATTDTLTIILSINGVYHYFFGNFSVQSGYNIDVNTFVAEYHLSANDEVTVEVRANSGNVDIKSTSFVEYSVKEDNTFINDALVGYKGDTNQWEFFKSLSDMFNWIVMPDENNPNKLLIEPYKDWVDAGDTLDWTNKIDVREMKFSIISGLDRKTNFSLAEDENDWITANHGKPNSWKYNYLRDNDIEIFDNSIGKMEVKMFASTYITRFQGGELICPMIIDKEYAEDWENVFRIFYDIGTRTLPGGIIDGYNYSDSSYLLFSPTNEVPTTSASLSTDFGILSYTSAIGKVLNTLYNTYWSQYLSELYDKNTRIVKVKAFLSENDVSNFKFNDVIRIKNKNYRIKQIDYRANQLSLLELITIKDL